MLLLIWNSCPSFGVRGNPLWGSDQGVFLCFSLGTGWREARASLSAWTWAPARTSRTSPCTVWRAATPPGRKGLALTVPSHAGAGARAAAPCLLSWWTSPSPSTIVIMPPWGKIPWSIRTPPSQICRWSCAIWTVWISAWKEPQWVVSERQILVARATGTPQTFSPAAVWKGLVQAVRVEKQGLAVVARVVLSCGAAASRERGRRRASRDRTLSIGSPTSASTAASGSLMMVWGEVVRHFWLILLLLLLLSQFYWRMFCPEVTLCSWRDIKIQELIVLRSEQHHLFKFAGCLNTFSELPRPLSFCLFLCVWGLTQ